MPKNLRIQIPGQGWKQFLTGRKEIIDAFDKARVQSGAHKVETYHGNVAEAAYRKWLSGFVPKRFAVTSGYVVSQGLRSTDKLPHFDVIVYNQLDSPVLWIEDNPDSSQQGRALAIPAEHVFAVLEVKSSFSAKTVKQAIDHLADLRPLMGGPDEPGARYPLHLPGNFSCGCVFFELRQEDMGTWQSLDEIVEGINLRGFWGGVVLRCEGKELPETGRISLLRGTERTERHSPSDSKSLLRSFAMSCTRQITESMYVGSMLKWDELNFVEHAFDLVAMMNGAYQVGQVSSFHAFGSSFLESNYGSNRRPGDGLPCPRDSLATEPLTACPAARPGVAPADASAPQVNAITLGISSCGRRPMK